jgi:hypothetical protein
VTELAVSKRTVSFRHLKFQEESKMCVELSE